jgi:hypothetical protein
MRPYEALDAVEHIFYVARILGDGCECQGSTLPEVLVLDLGGRNSEPAPRGVEKVAHDGPLLFQRSALRQVYFDREHRSVHEISSGFLVLLTDERGRARQETLEVVDLSLDYVFEPGRRVDLTRPGAQTVHNGVDQLRDR